jgi:hypothetical protein
MKQTIWSILGLLLLAPAFALGARIVVGDLNNDGIEDRAEIIWKGQGSLPVLVVTLKNVDGSVASKIESAGAICLGCGGPKAVIGEPLGELSIQKGILWISYKGGSRGSWSDTYKWRFDKKKNDFRLIGRTLLDEDVLREFPTERSDINFSIGKQESFLGKKRKVCSVKSAPIYLTTFVFEDRPSVLSCFLRKI